MSEVHEIKIWKSLLYHAEKGDMIGVEIDRRINVAHTYKFITDEQRLILYKIIVKQIK